jgi:hypothetical protein
MKAGQPGLWLGVARNQLSGMVESILGRGEHRWDRIGAVYVSDVYQFRGI